MELECKPDLEKSLQRFEAWWCCELLDRPPVNMSVPSGKPVEWPQKVHASQRERWLDIDHRLACQEVLVQSRIWTADSLPTLFGNLGPDLLATLYGAELEFTADTTLTRPVLHSSRQVLQQPPDLENEYWRWMRRMTERSIEQGRGRWITAITDLHTLADLLATLRDPQQLLRELLEDYEGVKEAILRLALLWDRVYDDLARRILRAQMPTTSWLLAPHRGRSCVLQADFIAMVAPEIFDEVFLPGLRYEMQRLDRSIFRLYGQNALQHLDALLQSPHLHAVQWAYGPGNGPAARWIEVYKRIQGAGKALHIQCGTMEDALAVAEHLKPAGCYFEIAADYTAEQVNAFLARLEKWSAGGAL